MQDALERSFNPSVVADFDAEAKRRAALTRLVTTRPERLNYGAGPRNRIDLYRPDLPNGSVLLYFHGGYWRSGEPADSGYLARPFLAAGTTVAIAGYDLCPAVTLATIVDQARAARDLLLGLASELAIDSTKFIVIGTSAGAQLCAMLLQDGPSAWPAAPAAALVTGVFDLEPVLRISVNAELHLTPADVVPLSPLRRAAALHCRRLLVAVGAEEPEPWQAMSRALAEKARAEGVATELFIAAGENHFSMGTALGRPEHPLCHKTLSLLAESP